MSADLDLDLDLSAEQYAWQEALKRAGGEVSVGLSKYRDDPVGFGHEVLGKTYWEAQESVLRALATHRMVTVRGARGWGKTEIGSDAVLWFGSTAPSRVLTMGPSAVQQEDQLWARINAQKVTSRIQLPGECHRIKWNIAPDWFALGRATDEPENIRGFHAGVSPLDALKQVIAQTKEPRRLLLLMDEALGIDQRIYDALQGSLSGGNVYVLLMANPTCAADAPHEFARSHQPGSGYHRIWVSAEPVADDEVGADESFDHVPEWLIKPEWIAKMRKDYGEKHPIYLADVRGQFSSAAVEWQIVTRTLLDITQDADLPDDGSPKSRHIGVDIAREGGDKCVAVLTIGGAVASVHSWRTTRDPSSLMTTAGIVIQLLKKWGPAGRDIPSGNVHLDKTGLGSGVVDRLRQCGYYVDGVDFGSAAIYDHKRLTGQAMFQNRKSELFWVVRRALEEGEASIPAKYDEIRQQLQWHRYKLIERGGGTQIGMREPKDEIIRRHGASPDFADACVLAWSRGSGALPGFRML